MCAMPIPVQAALVLLWSATLGVTLGWAATVPGQLYLIFLAVRDADPATRRMILEHLMKCPISWSFPYLVRITCAAKRWR
jgi:hypothetical protein